MNEENLIARLENISSRYNEINNELMKPEVVTDIKKMQELQDLKIKYLGKKSELSSFLQ